MKENHVSYIRCRNCGKYVEKNQSVGTVYCSEKCAGTFTRCPNCGKFFPVINIELHNGFCSAECEAVYGEDGILISSEADNSQKNNT